MSKTYRELLKHLKQVEIFAPEVLNQPVLLESFHWDSGETTVFDVDEIETVVNGEKSSITLKHSNY